MQRFIKTFRGELLAVPGRLIVFCFFVSLFFIPLVVTSPHTLSIFIMVNIYVIFAVSWDFLAGFAGQLSFGHAAFFGIAAYISALVNIHFGLPPAAAIILGAIGGAIMGLVMGLPAMRIRGIYLALITLIFPLILDGFVFIFPDYTGGELGLCGISPLSHSINLSYYILLLCTLGSILLMWKLTDTKSSFVRTGVVLRGIQEDEIAARAVGINTSLYKLWAFAISGFFAGLSGALYVHVMGVIGPSTLELLTSFNPIIWTIFGGMGTIYGPVVGVYCLYWLGEAFFAFMPEIRMLVFAIVVLLVIFFMPQGIAVWIRDKIEKECPRCKLNNFAGRGYCRACGVSLHPEKR